MKVTVTIMAHPKRELQAKDLWDKLIIQDFKSVNVIWDNKNSEWDTGKRALLDGVNKGDWHIVLQDDAQLTPYFYENVIGAINNVPQKVIISLYTGMIKPMPERVKAAVDKCYFATWIQFDMLLWGVGLLIPSDHIKPMIEFVDTPEFENTLYDTKIGMFYQRNMLPIYYTMPSLVNHNDNLGSLLDHKDDLGARVAYRTANELIKWNSQTIQI